MGNNVAAAEAIPMIRQVVHQEPCLFLNETEEREEVEEASGDARSERRRRKVERTGSGGAPSEACSRN